MTDITKLSASKLEALLTKLDAAASVHTNAFIQAGRGNWRGTDIQKAALEGDEMSIAWVKANDARYEVSDEKAARLRYSGSLKPIKRAA